MSDTDARLIYMAEQIARNFVAQGELRATLAVVDHIATFWDPRMRARLLAMPEAAFGAVLSAAVARLRSGSIPDHQTLATTIDGSDAG